MNLKDFLFNHELELLDNGQQHFIKEGDDDDNSCQPTFCEDDDDD